MEIIMRTEEEIKADMYALKAELAEVQGSKVKVGYCYLFKNEYLLKLIRVTGISGSGVSSLLSYNVDISEFQSYRASTIRTSLYEHDLISDKIMKISPDKYDLILKKLKTEIAKITAKARKDYNDVVATIDFTE